MAIHVLVVDDSLTVRMDLRGALAAAGFSVTACESKRAAERALMEGGFSLVVLDVMLPDGTGIELLDMIRGDATLSRTPVVMLSTEAEVRDRVRGLVNGADEYVGKPYDIAYLIRRIRALCEDAEARKNDVAGGGRRILAVDDSPTYLEALGRHLRQDGHDVVLARSGGEALYLLAVQAVDCVVLDLVMPDLDGLETLRRMRRMPGRESTPTMVLTGSTDPADQQSATDAGVDEFVRKSVAMDQIRAKIRSLLRGRRATGEASTRGGGAAVRPSNRVPSRGSTPNPKSSRWADDTLFAQAAEASGLSSMLARTMLSNALSRAGVVEGPLTPSALRRALPMVREALSLFHPLEDVSRRMGAVVELISANERPRA